MIANATAKHRLRGLLVDCLDRSDPWRILGAASFIVYYLHKYRADDIRPISVDDAWEGGDCDWPFVPYEPFDESEAWEKRNPAADLVDDLAGLGILLRMQDPIGQSHGLTKEIWQYRHILSRTDDRASMGLQSSFELTNFVIDPGWNPCGSVWYMDQTAQVRISLNTFTRTDLLGIIKDGRGCAVATHRMFRRGLAKHRVAVASTDEPWPFEDGRWKDLDGYTDITMDEIRSMIEDKTLLIRPDSVGKPIGPGDLVHIQSQEAVEIWTSNS